MGKTPKCGKIQLLKRKSGWETRLLPKPWKKRGANKRQPRRNDNRLVITSIPVCCERNAEIEAVN